MEEHKRVKLEHRVGRVEGRTDLTGIIQRRINEIKDKTINRRMRNEQEYTRENRKEMQDYNKREENSGHTKGKGDKGRTGE